MPQKIAIQDIIEADNRIAIDILILWLCEIQSQITGNAGKHPNVTKVANINLFIIILQNYDLFFSFQNFSYSNCLKSFLTPNGTIIHFI